MAKKQKRQVSGGVNRVDTQEASQSAAVSSRPGSSTDFNPDYSYVISDLKKIGLLALFFILVLIALSFFIG